MSMPSPGADEYEGGAGLPAFLRDPIGVLRRGWLWLLLGFALVLAPTLFGASIVPLQYEASTRLLLSAKRIPDEYVPTTILASASEQFQTIRGEVFTRPVLSEIIQETRLYAEDWDSVPMDVLADRLRDSIEIESTATRDATGLERSIAYRIALQGGDPNIVAAVVNAIAGRLIETDIAYRSEQSRVTSDFMRREFEQADSALREHQRRLAAFREQYRGSLPDEESATIAKLDRLESQRRGIILQINDNQLRARIATNSPAPQAPRGEFDRLRERLAEAEALYTEDHPNVVSLRRQVEQASAARATSPPSSLDDAQRVRDLASLRQQLADIEAEVGRLEALVSQTPEITEEFRALEREEEILQESYDEYLRKLQAAELAQSMENAQKGARLTRIEQAFAPRSPVIPRIVFYGLAAVLSLAAGGALCLVHELVRPVVIDAAHLARLTDLPVLGEVPPVR